MWTGGVYWLSNKKSYDSINNNTFCSKYIVPAINESEITGWKFYHFISSAPLSESTKPSLKKDRINLSPQEHPDTKEYLYTFFTRVYDDKVLIASELSSVIKAIREVDGLKQIMSKRNSVQYRINEFVRSYYQLYKNSFSENQDIENHELLKLQLNYSDAKVSTFGEKIETIILKGEDIVTSSVFESTLPDSFFRQVGISLISEASDSFRLKENGSISYRFRSKMTYKRIQKILYLLRKYDFVVSR